jgi:hypothetical protein
MHCDYTVSTSNCSTKIGLRSCDCVTDTWHPRLVESEQPIDSWWNMCRFVWNLDLKHLTLLFGDGQGDSALIEIDGMGRRPESHESKGVQPICIDSDFECTPDYKGGRSFYNHGSSGRSTS